MTSLSPGLPADPGPVGGLEAENARLREQLESAERYTAQTLARATRLSQLISVLGQSADFQTVVERASVEIAELFSADIAVLLVGPDDDCTVAGQCGLRRGDVPETAVAIAGLAGLTLAEPVLAGPVRSLPFPAWLESYGAQHVAWARLLVGDKSLGLLLLVRRNPAPFERSDERELRAVAYRIALAIENTMLHRRMKEQLAQLHRIQEFTAQLAGTLELDVVASRVVETLSREVGVSGAAVVIEKHGKPVEIASVATEGSHRPAERFLLEASGRPLGYVAIADPPPLQSEPRELLLHLIGIAALALDKSLLYALSLEQARHDALTGLLGHRVFQERLEAQIADDGIFSVVMLDIDDFKQVNDLYGHQTGDDALRLVASVLRAAVREDDSVFRVGGEEFCVILPGLSESAALDIAERVRVAVSDATFRLPLTVSVGVACFPIHARVRDELLDNADKALYASKRTGKNCTTMAGAADITAVEADAPNGRTTLAELGIDDAETVAHSVRVTTDAVELARELGVEEGRLADLRVAARFHDIGKIGVPASVLNKPGPLDAEELQIIRTHPTVGRTIVEAWGFDRAARFVGEHHEYFDGSGYPNRLRGEEISLEARIIAVTDAVAAMTCDRPYRKALDRDAAMREIVRCAGTQFDPRVVDAVVALEARRGEREQAAAAYDVGQVA